MSRDDDPQHPIDAAIEHALSMARAGRPPVDTRAPTELYATLQDQPPTLQSRTDHEVNRDSGRASQLASGLEAIARALHLQRQDQLAEREARALQAAEHRDLRQRHDRLVDTVNTQGSRLASLGETRMLVRVGVALLVVVLALCLVLVALQGWEIAHA